MYFRKENEGRGACACEIERGGDSENKGAFHIKRKREIKRMLSKKIKAKLQ